MKNRKLEIWLLITAYILTTVTLLIALHQGISRAQIFIYSTDFIILLLWTFSVMKRKPTR